MTPKFHYQCINCKGEYGGEKIIYLCPVCQAENKQGQPPKGVLKTIYNYEQIRGKFAAGSLFQELKKERFLPLLPLKGFDSWPQLRIGDTPLYEVQQRTGGLADRRTSDQFDLYLKDDSQNPTFSFKDRASALVSAWARENKIETLITASTGNAGSSLAGICASQGQKSIIVVPASAPLAKLTQILMYGAVMVPVKGTYDDAFDLSIRISEQYGYYNRNTAFNPLTLEGKKTVSFELYEQLHHKIPDRIFVPVGDGVILSGVYKGFEDLFHLGIIDRMPVVVAVQAEGSCNLINNISSEQFNSVPSETIAHSISVDIPRNFHMAAEYLKHYKGEWLTVTDDEILQASVKLSGSTGVFSEPAAAAAFAGIMKYRDEGLIPPGSKNVVLLTGSGLKDLKSVQSSIRMPDPIEPEIVEVREILGDKMSNPDL
jgi:threonine synthase